MQSIKLLCQIITPMFMAGANVKTPELRASEFKGMMRFWWRAIKAEDDIEKLREDEAKIFGGTGEVQGKSKVRIRIDSSNLKEGDYWPLPHKKNFKSKCYLPNSTFHVELVIYDNKYEELIKDLFISISIFGGFGKRSRRGFGSIEIIEPKIEVNYSFMLSLLNKIQNSYQLQNNKIINIEKGSKKYPWIKEIEIGKAYGDVDKLLKKIGEATHNHKNPSLGNAKPRMASPVYVSVIKNGKFYKPIITTLNSFFPPDNYPNWNCDKQKEFKEEILK